MLKDIVEFVKSRAGIPDRSTALREINFAWREIWNIDDLPNSLFEITVVPSDGLAMLTLPFFVGKVRGVKCNRSRIRVELNSPRARYQSDEYIKSPFTWDILGTTPLKQNIVNCSTLDLTIVEPESEELVVTLMGPTDNTSEDREQVIFAPGELTKRTKKRFVDLIGLSKNILTQSDVQVTGPNREDLATIPNCYFGANNIIIQIREKNTTFCPDCECYDVLYKRVPPILYHDETPIPNGYDEALMTKTLEWITLPKDGQEQKMLLYAEKAKALLSVNNENEGNGKVQRIDVPTNMFTSHYHGYL